jgi:AraC-like DNA-binding protein
MYFYTEALKPDPAISDFIKALTGISTVKASEGYHTSALKGLEMLIPLVKYAEPLTYFQMMNSYAVELIEANRLPEAHNAAVVAVSSPLGPFYPEWEETLADVRSKRKPRSTVAISQSQIEQEYETESGVRENVIRKAKVRAVIDFMNANLHRSLALAELARMINLSTSYFCRLFKIEIGLSALEYLIRLRMEKACHLLATTFLSIKQIIAEVGCNNKSNFLRHFKRYVDLVPSEYRKRAYACAS